MSTTKPIASPTMSIVNVAPATAEKWLGKMPRNRHLSPGHVATYARDMLNGSWDMTGEAIKFDRDGNLLDGQHRLHAVVSAGVTVKMFVVHGLDTAAQDVMDTGRKRGAADALTLGGYPNSSNLAAVAKLGVLYARGDIKTANQSGQPTVTHAEILRFVNENPTLHAACSTVASLGRSVPVRPAALGFVLFILNAIDDEQALGFISDLANMRTSGAGDPKYTLLRRLAAVKQNNERMSAITEAHYMFRTWNALRQGEGQSAVNLEDGERENQIAI